MSRPEAVPLPDPAPRAPLCPEGELRLLPPGRLGFALSPAGQLRLTVRGWGSFRAVRLARCFPLSDPGRFVSVRDALSDGAEIGVIADLGELAPADRRLAGRALAGACLLPRIIEVGALRREFGYLYWETRTDRGGRAFATQDSLESVLRLPDGGAVLTDTDECCYRLPPPEELPRTSRALLARHLPV